MNKYEGLSPIEILEKAQRDFWMEIVEYYPNTGLFYWKVGNNMCDVAGYNNKGYIYIKYIGQEILAHRLAFLIMEGYLPEQVDHGNHIRNDNRWFNLNESNSAHNAKNMSIYSNNTSGFTGVNFNKVTGKWMARIYVDGKRIVLGSFVHKQEAINARSAANIQYGFNPKHGKMDFKESEPDYVVVDELMHTSKLLNDVDYE